MEKAIFGTVCVAVFVGGAALPFILPALPETVRPWAMLAAAVALAGAVGVLSYAIGAARALDKLHGEIMAQVAQIIRAHNATAPEAVKFALTDENPMRSYYGRSE